MFEPIETKARRQIAESVPDPKFHFDWALRLFAAASVERDNEVCYRLIYGSQIKALKAAVQGFGIIGDDKLKQLYDQAAFNFPEPYADFSFEQSRGFLTTQQLTSLEADGVLKLTPRAYAFMTFLATSGVSDEKWY